MEYADSSDFTIPSNDSNILSQSLLLPSSSSNASDSSKAGPSDPDLSLSELSLTDRIQPARRRPFSLLAQPRDESIDPDEEEDLGENDGLDQTMKQPDTENARKEAAQTREEKLQQDLFILKKLNAALDVYKGALRETKSSTEVLIHSVTSFVNVY